MPTIPLRERPSWKALQQHHAEIGGRHLRDLFAEDPNRGERLCAEAAGLYLDYSKNRVTDETLSLLKRLADECGVAERSGGTGGKCGHGGNRVGRRPLSPETRHAVTLFWYSIRRSPDRPPPFRIHEIPRAAAARPMRS